MSADSSDVTPHFDWGGFHPIPNNWLETDLTYEGQGTAEFASPKGTVAGPFVARFDEQGSSSIETVFDTLSPRDIDYEGNPIAFLHGAKLQRSGKATNWGIVGMDNPCESLSFATASGTFLSTGKVDWAGINWGTGPTRLRFSVREGKLETSNSQPAKYFAMPLFNCVAELANQLHGEHPLRIFPTPSVPDDVPLDKQKTARLLANQKNVVLAFYIDGKLCFIERLPDYEIRVAALKSGTARQKVTAVLVGDVGNNPVATLEDFRSWFPYGIVSALAFASGVEVGWPWIEIRDVKGGLIRRLHGSPRFPSFFDGDEVFGRLCRPGAGEFINRFVTLPENKRSYLQAVMNHARLGSLGPHLHLYDLVDHLVRALECLCREHKHPAQDLMAELSGETQNRLAVINTELVTKLDQLKDRVNQLGNLDDYRLLTEIKARAASIAQRRSKLHSGLPHLLNKFSLCDTDILDIFLRSQGRPDWVSLVASYRHATIHEGYLDFSAKHDAREVIRISAHLKDVLTRIVLKECGYSGTYDSGLRRNHGPQPIDWVRRDTKAADLGFT